MQRTMKADLAILLTVAIALPFLMFQYGYFGLANAKPKIEVHVTVLVEHVDGTIEGPFHHAGVLTNGGKDFIEGKLGDSAFANATDYAKHISLSSDTSTPSATWVVIPAEITSGGLDRNTGTYTSTGVGQWKVEYQFTATATHTNVQLTGLNWKATDNDYSLFAADTFTAVTLASGDKITVTWTITVS